MCDTDRDAGDDRKRGLLSTDRAEKQGLVTGTGNDSTVASDDDTVRDEDDEQQPQEE